MVTYTVLGCSLDGERNFWHMSNFFWYRHIPHHGAPRTGSGALSLLSPGAIFMIFAMLLLFAPRIAFGFLALLFLIVGGVLLYFGITLWRIKRHVLKDFESVFSESPLNRTRMRARFGGQSHGDKSSFFDRSYFSDMRSTEKEGFTETDGAEITTYEIDVDSIEVLDPEPDDSGKRRRRWYRLH